MRVLVACIVPKVLSSKSRSSHNLGSTTLQNQQTQRDWVQQSGQPTGSQHQYPRQTQFRPVVTGRDTGGCSSGGIWGHTRWIGVGSRAWGRGSTGATRPPNRQQSASAQLNSPEKPCQTPKSPLIARKTRRLEHRNSQDTGGSFYRLHGTESVEQRVLNPLQCGVNGVPKALRCSRLVINFGECALILLLQYPDTIQRAAVLCRPAFRQTHRIMLARDSSPIIRRGMNLFNPWIP